MLEAFGYSITNRQREGGPSVVSGVRRRREIARTWRDQLVVAFDIFLTFFSHAYPQCIHYRTSCPAAVRAG